MDKDEKTTKMWKIEGESFEKVKAAYSEAVQAAKDAERIREEKKTAVWTAIREAVPELEGKDSLNLNTDCESLGFYVIKEGCDHGKGLLGALLAAAKGC